MNRTSQNIFASFLSLLHVKFTAGFSTQYYNEHPHKSNLWGLSDMLSGYGVENMALRIKEEERGKILDQLEPPFIAYVGNDFGLIHEITDKEVHYAWKGKVISLSKKAFVNSWGGVLLVAETNKGSIEPDYHKHHKDELISLGKKITLLVTLVMLLGLTVFAGGVYKNLGLSAGLVINCLGIWICYLLLLKQMHIQSDYADKICSLLLHQGDCNNVLESEASRFLGIFSWSEIGLGYFCGNLLLILFLPALYPYVVWINICAIPYTVWSVWYQKVMAKQWCPLCLCVQAIIWSLFIVNLLSGSIVEPDFTFLAIFFVGCIYIIPVLALNLLIPNLADSKKTQQIKQEINSLKADEGIFKAELSRNARYEVDKSTSALLWGNLDAPNLITVITNPHCNPCAMMHTRLENLLRTTHNGYCVQYILTSFSGELEDSSKFLIAMYRKMDVSSFLLFLNEWYESGKDNRIECYRKYHFNHLDEKDVEEFMKHKEWVTKTKINSTPTVLFNGYRMPDKYKMEDLVHFYKNQVYI